MNYTTFLNSIAEHFQMMILKDHSVNILDTPDFGWTNHRYVSDVFRLAHIERYSDGKIEVLHVTTFPHKWSPEPIFGFDVICTDNKIVGAYMDLSPVINTYPFDEGVDFEERKPLPEWATVFSDRFILLKPKNDDEFLRFCDWVLEKYEWYIRLLHTKSRGDVEKIVAAQNKYCEVQSINPRTYSVLKTKIGEERASYFMKEILFPRILDSE